MAAEPPRQRRNQIWMSAGKCERLGFVFAGGSFERGDRLEGAAGDALQPAIYAGEAPELGLDLLLPLLVRTLGGRPLSIELTLHRQRRDDRVRDVVLELLAADVL